MIIYIKVGVNRNSKITMAKKLYRSKKNRKIAGICGGIAEYFDIDPTIIRLIALILVLSAGGGIIVYLIGWIIVPEEPESLHPVPVQ
jgi:phage shock protein C